MTALKNELVDIPEPVDCELRWHVLLTEPMAEMRAAVHLRRYGFSPYVPLLTRTTQMRVHTMFGTQRRSRKIVRAMFPGYIFLPLNIAWEFGPIYSVAGLRTGPSRKSNPFLRIDGVHAIVADEDVEIMREVEKALANPAIPGLPYKVGDKVKLLDGAFQDWVVTISRLDDAERIELLMDMLGRKTKLVASAKQIAAV